jgi:peroxiredoxin
VDVKDAPTSAQEFVNKFNLTYPLVRDPDTTFAKQLWETDVLPQSFFVDRSGAIVARQLGELDAKDLAAHIQTLLGSE